MIGWEGMVWLSVYFLSSDVNSILADAKGGWRRANLRWSLELDADGLERAAPGVDLVLWDHFSGDRPEAPPRYYNATSSLPCGPVHFSLYHQSSNLGFHSTWTVTSEV